MVTNAVVVFLMLLLIAVLKISDRKTNNLHPMFSLIDNTEYNYSQIIISVHLYFQEWKMLSAQQIKF